jgi:hypothetical protein
MSPSSPRPTAGAATDAATGSTGQRKAQRLVQLGAAFGEEGHADELPPLPFRWFGGPGRTDSGLQRPDRLGLRPRRGSPGPRRSRHRAPRGRAPRARGANRRGGQPRAAGPTSSRGAGAARAATRRERARRGSTPAAPASRRLEARCGPRPSLMNSISLGSDIAPAPRRGRGRSNEDEEDESEPNPMAEEVGSGSLLPSPASRLPPLRRPRSCRCRRSRGSSRTRVHSRRSPTTWRCSRRRSWSRRCPSTPRGRRPPSSSRSATPSSPWSIPTELPARGPTRRASAPG